MRYRAPLILLIAALSGCGRESTSDGASTVRVGYFPNLTHAQALAGLARGDFARALGPGVTIEPVVFNAGPPVIEAMFAKRIDLAYIGPNPAINGYVQSSGKALRIVAGATSAGAALVVRPDAGIESAADLAGKRLATPQIGNTQDVALRAYLARHGLRPRENGGDVDVIPTPNPQIIDLIRTAQLDGAWVPEPWASRLVVEAGCRVFLDERELWPNGDFVTAHVIVRTEYLETHPEEVRAWIDAHVAVTQWLLENPSEAHGIINAELERLTGKPLDPGVLSRAWSRLRPTWDPIATSLVENAVAAHDAGFLRARPDLTGIYDLNALNQVLRARALPEIGVTD